MAPKQFRDCVSVIVPAYNAEATLDETLASLKVQTFPNWEAIIVDDGSTDKTAAIAANWARQDSRFRLVRQPNGGESAARNTGIREAKNNWLVFLDSDDWLAPEYLELMTAQLAVNPQLNAVACGCVRVTPDGQQSAPALYGPSFFIDPFPEFVRDCPLAIHNCMVQRSLVEAIGEFDTSLVTCADWDFWQRVTRVGARFGTVPAVLAFYRIRPGSSSTRAERVLIDGMNVIRRGHAPDPRVPNPHPNYADGLPIEGLSEALYRHALWPASLMLGQGKDACALLQFMGQERAPTLDPEQVAYCLFDSIPLAAASTTEDWFELWPAVEERLRAYLVGLEAQSGAVSLAQQSLQQLERLIIESAELKQPLSIGSSYGVCLNIHQPVTDVIVPDNAKVIVCIVNAGDQAIGSVQVPVTGRIVDGNTIGEAIRTDLAWPLMLWYFHLNLPPDSLLKVKLYWLLQESRPLYIARGMAGLIWPLFYWQLCTGLLREPRLLARFLGLVLRMRSVRFGLQLIRAKSRPRKYLVKEFLWDMARQFVREERLVTTAPTAASTQTMASEGDCSYIKILWGCIRRVALK